jgi:hypothetical protein
MWINEDLYSCQQSSHKIQRGLQTIAVMWDSIHPLEIIHAQLNLRSTVYVEIHNSIFIKEGVP